MMDIRVITSVTDERASFAKEGDSLIINGEMFDFSPLLEGERLPIQAIASTFFADNVERTDGVLRIAIRMPISMELYVIGGIPDILIDAPDGPLDLPPEPEITPPELAPETLPVSEGLDDE